MATIYDKLVDMLATVQSIRKGLKKPIARTTLTEVVAQKGNIGQPDLFESFSNISPRTLRRKIDLLIRQGMLQKTKNGREVYYSVGRNYQQK